MRIRFPHLVVLCAVLAAPAGAADLPTAAADARAVSESLRREARAALDRGADWLIRRQDASGSWSNPGFPALTGLPVWALAGAGRNGTDSVAHGVNYILSCVHPDGSIWVEPSQQRKGGGLSNYNTAICMIALHRVNDPKLAPTVAKARRFVAGSQHRGPDAHRGGMGYDPDTGRPYADLSNSYISYEAMRLTLDLKDLQASEAVADLDWEAAQAFLAGLANSDGGFIYSPGMSQAGAETNAAGEVTFRSYGSMTYAGLLSLIYAEVEPEDPRVTSAFEWAADHWTLAENPGMGQEGLYYFYNVLSKALAAYGRDTFATGDGTRVSWRGELIRTLLNLQQVDPEHGDGFWVNPAGRWFEADPVLVTAYAMIALEVALGEE